MNMTTLLTRIRLRCGMDAISFPFDFNNFVQEIVETVTIPVFSLYCPYRQKLHTRLGKLEEIAKGSDFQTVLLPSSEANPIVNVEGIEYDETTLVDSNTYGYIYPTNYRSVYETLVLGSAGLNLGRANMPSITCEFEPPNRLTVYHAYISQAVIIKLALQHSKSLVTIKPTTSESFFKLAWLDVAGALYNTLKYYNEIPSTGGAMTLRIDEFQSAISEREDLLNKWDDEFHLDGPQFIYK